MTRWYLLKLARTWKSGCGGIRLRIPNIFWRVKITVWG
jgi:hypothetical protein